MTVQCAWWHHPEVKEPSPLDAVRVAVECLDAGHPVPPPEAKLISRALRQFLAGQRDITGNLGLRAKRGGRFESPVSAEIKAQRDKNIKLLYEMHTDGRRCARAEKVAAMLNKYSSTQNADGGEISRLVHILAEFGGDLPTSSRQVLRIVDSK